MRSERRLPRRSAQREGGPWQSLPVQISAKSEVWGRHMKYVYILYSTELPDRHYTGITDDLRERMAKHNAGAVAHTAKYRPWQLQTYIAFSDENRAFAFEKYLKSPSGRAFAKKRL
jgi:putative endonuclease